MYSSTNYIVFIILEASKAIKLKDLHSKTCYYHGILHGSQLSADTKLQQQQQQKLEEVTDLQNRDDRSDPEGPPAAPGLPFMLPDQGKSCILL